MVIFSYKSKIPCKIIENFVYKALYLFDQMLFLLTNIFDAKLIKDR